MSQSFTDTAGRSWAVSVNVASLKRVKEALGVDLADVVGEDGGVIARLASDPALLVDVLYVLCRSQAAETGVSDEQFGEAMSGDVLADATDAFVEALIQFFPHAPTRENLRKYVATLESLRDKVARIGAERLADPELEDRVLAAVREAMRDPSPSVRLTSGERSTEPPGSSASIRIA